MKIKKPPVAVRVLLGIVSVLLCIALFATAIVAMVIADVQVLTNKDNLQTFISQILFATPKKSAPVILRQGVGIGGVRLDEPEAGLTDTQQMIVDYVYDMLEEQFGEEMPITEEKVEKLLEQSTVPEFLSEKMASIVSDIYTGKVTTTITKEEVLTLMEENKELIEDTFGVEITQEQMDTVADWVEEADIVGTVEEVVKGNWGMKDTENYPPAPGEDSSKGTSTGHTFGKGSLIESVMAGEATVESIMAGGVPTILAAIRELTSTTMLLTVLGICAVIVVLLFLANYWKPHAAVRCVGITAMIAALPFLVPTILVLAVPAMFADATMTIVALILKLTAVVCISVFAGGVILLAGSIVWGSLAKKKARAPAAAPVEQIPVMQDVPVMQESPVQPEAPAEETQEI